MKIVGFVGSPRIGGNSDILLDQCLKGAEESGAEVKKIYLDKLSINPCRACDACRHGKTGCIIQDDMQNLYKELEEADVWVLATPVYWWGPSAQLKLMVDRWYGFYKTTDLNQKAAALIITMEETRPSVANATKTMFDEAFYFLKMKQANPLVVSADEKGEVRNDQEAMQKAYQMGMKLANK